MIRIINKIKNISVILGLTYFFSFTLSGCDSELNTESETSLSAGEIFQTQTRIEGLVNGMYKALKGASMFGGRIHLYLDVRGEDFINVTGNSYTAYESWTNSYTSGSNDINNTWQQAYAAINNANIIIDGLAKSTGVISDEVKTQYVAEAKFVRALSYYTLVTIYARPYTENDGASKGLPLRLQAETTSANNDLARSTVKEVYKQILEDLDFAETNLPDSYSSSALNTTRAHKSTAIALKTRVYLNKGDFQNVIAEAKKIVPQTDAPFSATTGVKHALQSDITTLFGSNFLTTESILSMPSTASDSYSGQSAIAYVYYSNKEYYLNPSGILGSSLWGTNDARRNLIELKSGKYYLKKYTKVSPYIDYIPVIRYSEILLNYAEAALRTNNNALAIKLLEAVHHRSDAGFVFPASSENTSTALLETIRQERRIELLGEGFRSNDLLRDLLTIPAKGSSSLQAAQVLPSAENYIFPLPDSETNTNKAL
ncbi:SusD family protein [Bacteroides luti]|uniref:SusD family protein n=1 Tax=Bacteroides luti TaxID=1297750 RepID=A0A1M5GZD2_9BACE|nr:RagB/SusD family nutrient uptake outer membrane protein [Bacteroides luti]SHG09094.1 SusD family protein [Bacteroides luti]